MARKISISFKETKRDLELYEYINSLDDKSAEIKSILREAFKDKLNNENKSLKKKDKNINVMDF